MAAPLWIAPMLAAGRAPEPLPAEGWAYEPKWDGWRCLARIHDGAVTLMSRTLTNLTPRFPELHAPPAALAGREAYLDAELVALDEEGSPSFRLLGARHARSRREPERAAREIAVRLVLFDVLYLDGLVLDEPWERRRALLDGLAVDEPAWTVTPVAIGERAGDELLETTAGAGVEGVVAKRLGSAYRPGERSDDWVKIKHAHARDLRERAATGRSWGSGRSSLERRLPRIVLAD